MSWVFWYIVGAYSIRVVMVPVVLRRHFAPGAAMAWLGIVFLHPYIGVTLYLLLGEVRLGAERDQRHREIVAHYRSGTENDADATWDVKVTDLGESFAPLILQARKMSGLPVVGGAVELLPTCDQLIARLAADIDAANSEVHLMYYIFAPDLRGQRIAEAMIAAAKRGVRCRVLADAVGSRAFFHRDGLAHRLRQAGIEVAAAMPVAPISRGLPRMDLRNHRKIAFIDGTLAYAGSHNVIDPDYGGRRGAPWVDITGRFTGAVARQLGLIFAEDWAFETGQMLDVPHGTTSGTSPMQVVPTGPAGPGLTYRRLLVGAIQSARRNIVLTTPYFVPDEPTLVAMLMAADRGVNVQLLVPLVSDHIFTGAAGRAHFTTLMEGGVSIYRYRPGLLHAKTVTIDDAVGLLSSANLDVRSFNLNFELTVLLYGKAATDSLRAVQYDYLNNATRLDAGEWCRRSIVLQYADNAATLLSPLL